MGEHTAISHSEELFCGLHHITFSDFSERIHDHRHDHVKHPEDQGQQGTREDHRSPYILLDHLRTPMKCILRVRLEQQSDPNYRPQ